MSSENNHEKCSENCTDICKRYKTKENIVSWTSGNEEIDKFVRSINLKIDKNSPDIIFEWIPYNQFSNMKEIFKDTIYLAKWKNGPLYICNNEFIRKSDTIVTLKYLPYSQNEFLNKVEVCLKNLNNAYKIYGISQNPDTNNYIIVLEDEYKKYCINCDKIYTNLYYKWCKPCQINYFKKSSGNENIDNFIQKMQLQIINPTDIVLEWIPYDQVCEIKEIGNGVFSAIWKVGPLFWKDKEYIREPNKKVAFRYLENITEESLIEYKKDSLKFGIETYGISQDPSIEAYIIILQDKYCKQCGNIYTDSYHKWCKECQINHFKENFANWTSENKDIDELIQEKQLKIDEYDDIVFEWVPYNHFNNIKEIDKSGFAVVYSAKWRNGPLCYNVDRIKYTRDLNKTIALKCSHNSQNTNNKFLDEVKKCLSNNFKMYGITQNSNTKDYMIIFHSKYFEKGFCVKCNNKYTNSNNKWCQQCQIKYLKENLNWTSGNEIVDNFIQEMQLKIKSPSDKIFEWIPYNQFNNIKEIDNDRFSKIYSAKWKNGLLYWDNGSMKYIRKLGIKVTLKSFYNLQNVNQFLNEVKIYLKDDIKDAITNITIYGISQNLINGEYVMVFHNECCVKCGELYTNTTYNWCKPCQIKNLEENFTNWTSGNKEIDKFIQNEQSKIGDLNDMIFEWIPYNQFNDFIKIDNDKFVTIYSAKWKDGPLCWNNRKYIRKLHATIALKCLHNAQNINHVLNEVKPDLEIHGISQNPDTKNYIIVLQNEYCKRCDKIYTDIQHKWCKPCQIEYLVNLTNWTSGNEKIDNFVKEIQLKIKKLSDIIFEWIPYNQFNNFIKIDDDECVIIYSAKWNDGPLYWNTNNKEYLRKSDTKVTLKYSQFIIDEVETYLTNNHDDINDTYIDTIYGISQNPDTKEYIVVFREECCAKCNKVYINTWNKWCGTCQKSRLERNFVNWTSNNKSIDNLIQEMQLKLDDPSDIIFEWIPYNQFSDIKEINKSSFATIYTSIWKDGPFYWNNMMYKRDSNKTVTLKCLNDLQNNTGEFLNKKVKEYSIKSHYCNNIYGISRNEKYNVIVLQDNYYKNHCLKCDEIYTSTYYKWCKPCQMKSFTNSTSKNKEIDDYVQEMQLRINSDSWDVNSWDKVFEWIPYNQFHNINKVVDEDEFTLVYSAKWINGPLYYNINQNKYMRSSEKTVALKCLKCLNNSQNITNELIDKVKTYSFNLYGILEIYGISHNPIANEYVMVLHNKYFEKEFEKYCVKCGNNYTDIQYKWCKPCQLDSLKKNPTNWISRNEKINNFIQEMVSKINDLLDIVFEWIPYDQFDNVNEIDKGGFATVYSAIWKNGPSFYNPNKKKYLRHSNKTVALKRLYNSHDITNEFLNEIKEYSIDRHSNNILRIYGLSQDPVTKEYIIVLEYAEGGNFNSWVNKNGEKFSWLFKINTLLNISNGLKMIHQKHIVHRDLHTGNILFFTKNINIFSNSIIYISDMGLCGEVGKIDKSCIYGVMPYVAPEVLRGRPYTQAADIYSFGMIMYFAATGRQPFADCAHDELLALDICQGSRPKIDELEAPKCYIDLMKICWDPNPKNRKKSDETYEQILMFRKSYRGEIFDTEKGISKEQFNKSYKGEILGTDDHDEIEKQFKKAEEYRKDNLLSNKNSRSHTTHPKAVYTSRLLNSFTKNLPKYEDTECLDCKIVV
ncbi:Cla4p [Rhizophagus irregularis DAOM 197198w]|uniref:Cla4p n=1 Tax=Rhizophagus irregularis (strain DAOM 197198w) TaxID=1432141 RepID=A0A015LF04_RHIIW|nr:Cla4p [Rhizophagus irregularis DAOM 197198w]